MIIHRSLNLKRRKRPAPLVFSCFLSVTFLFMEFADILSNKDLYKLPVELLFVLHFLKQVPDAVQNVDLCVRCSTKPLPQKWQEELYQWQASWLVSHKLADSEKFQTWKNSIKISFKHMGSGLTDLQIMILQYHVYELMVIENLKLIWIIHQVVCVMWDFYTYLDKIDNSLPAACDFLPCPLMFLIALCI